LIALRKLLILRRPRQRPSRRTHSADPADRNFLSILDSETHHRALAGMGFAMLNPSYGHRSSVNHVIVPEH
jgi:hypothetical protein